MSDNLGTGGAVGKRPLFGGRTMRLLGAAAFVFGLAGGWAGGLQALDDLSAQVDRFAIVYFQIQNQYVEPIKSSQLVESAVQGMLETLDPHSVHLPRERYNRFADQFRDNYSGIGIQFEVRRGELIVIAPLEGTPASRLGIRSGDRIVAVDGNPVGTAVTNDDVFKLLRGPEGSTVHVDIRRPGAAVPLAFDIARARIPQESVRYAHMIRPGVGYVRIVRFASATGDELDRALTKLSQEGMKQLILDLRMNPGGLLPQAIEVSNRFIGAGQRIVYTRGRTMQAHRDYYADDRDRKYEDVPLVVLLDHGSASASEIVAGAIQDLDRGVVAGTTSFGKGLVQNQIQLEDGSGLLLTVSKYYTPSGRLIQRDYATHRETYQIDAWKEDAPSESVLAARPKFTTTGGRTVYGGGGIIPDAVLPSDRLTVSEREVEQSGALFETATRLAPPLRERWLRFDDYLARFQPDAADLGTLREEIDKAKATLSDSAWTAEKPYLTRRLKAEIAGNLFGVDARYRVDLTGDTQVDGALTLLPQAEKLLAEMLPLGTAPSRSAREPDDSNAERRNR
jgi:carboxyl-terminal processing protease